MCTTDDTTTQVKNNITFKVLSNKYCYGTFLFVGSPPIIPARIPIPITITHNRITQSLHLAAQTCQRDLPVK